LEQKNLEVEQNAEALKTANAQIQSNNKNLEALVELRTKKVIEQAQKFQAFSQKNSHELRAPLTNIMALLDQLKNTNSDETREQILQHLEKACIDLDRVIHDINDLLSSDK
jgi:signal transduction histidine kinase